MARFEDMLPDARAGLPAAPDPVILGALRRAAAALCRESHVWQEVLDDQPAVPGQSEYDIGAPSGARVERAVWVKYKGALLDFHVRDRELLAQSAVPGVPRAYSTSTAAQVLHLWPTPAVGETGPIAVYATLVPLPSATTLPDDIAIAYRPGLIALAKADLMALSPGMPWHNLKEAAVQSEIGHEWIVRAKRNQHSGGHVPLRAAPRMFA